MNSTPHAKSILVTGAGAGIGSAIAHRFAAGGWRVGATDVDAEGLDRLRIETGATVFTADVRREDDWARVLEQFCGSEGALDCLVNNAGVLAAGPFTATTFDEHRGIVEVNLVGTMLGAHASFPHLQRSADHPVLVNMCSASAIYGQPELASYSATKFAVRGLSEALDLEWESSGIDVVALWPLFVDTPMLHGVETGSTASLGVRLTVSDVADEVWRSVTRPSRRRVHRRVGLQAKALAAGTKLGPAVVNRRVVRGLTMRGRRVKR